MKLRRLANSGIFQIIAFFFISRSVMIFSGFRIHVNYAFMHFHEVELLRHNFWESILYTHAFTPWINILVGFVLRFPESMHIFIYQAFFYAMSLSALLILHQILYHFNFKAWLCLVTVVFFSLTPAYIYFEHFLSYTFPSMVLLLVATYCLIIALVRDTFRSWLIFFSGCIFLCFVRTTFHYIWLVAVILGIFLVQKRVSKKVTLAFVIPTIMLLGWYMKNLVLFGFFGASSWAGFNLSFTTTQRLNITQKKELVLEEKLSPLAIVPIYSGIEDYHEFVHLDEETGIAVLDNRGKGVPGWKNYNHKGFIKLSTLRMEDNLAYMRLFPFKYFKTFVLGVIQFFGPSTRWHPHDKLGSPHKHIRKKVEVWEVLYNSILHSLPFRKVGLYVFFIIVFGLTLVRYVIDVFRWKSFTIKEKLIAFSVMNIFYVTTLSCLVTFGELSRYRFMIEPLIWIVILVFCTDQIQKYKSKWS